MNPTQVAIYARVSSEQQAEALLISELQTNRQEISK